MFLQIWTSAINLTLQGITLIRLELCSNLHVLEHSSCYHKHTISVVVC